MSHLIIKKNIERLLKEKNWRVADLENKIGQGRSVTNIFRGTSKNPTIEVLQSIAGAFNIEIQELLLDHDNQNSILNISLLRDTCDKIINELELIHYPIAVRYSNVFALIKEVYEYSSQLSLDKADENFTKWLIQKHYKK